jgi:transposase-like protein
MPDNHDAMIRAIARREGTVRELAHRFGIALDQLRKFAADHMEEIKEYAQQQTTGEPTPEDLDSLWITNKTQRLRRLQEIAEISYRDITAGDLVGAELATATREFRSYLMLAANELGQLLHRGAGDSGEGNYLSVEMNGVNMDELK